MKPNSYYLFQSMKGKELTAQQVRKDIVAGMIVAIIALPLSVGLAISSGVSPERGIITAVVCGLCVSLLGGNSVQISGPTATLVAVTYVTLNQYGIEGVLFATLLAGLILLIAGLCRIGTLVKYIPETVIAGFTAGVGAILLAGQIKNLVGMDVATIPTDFIGKCVVYMTNLQHIHMAATVVGIGCILLIILVPKVTKKIPPYLVVLIVGVIVTTIAKVNVPTIVSEFGSIQLSLQGIGIPMVAVADMPKLIGPAVTMAILIGMESLLSAVVAEEMIGEKHHSNMELIGQGVGNMMTAVFGGIPGAGVMARTAANANNGGRTAISGIVHAVGLLLMVGIFMPLIQYVPLAALAAILVVVAYHMMNFPKLILLCRRGWQPALEVIATAVLTVTMDLVLAVMLAMFLHIGIELMSKRSGSSTITLEENEG